MKTKNLQIDEVYFKYDLRSITSFWLGQPELILAQQFRNCLHCNFKDIQGNEKEKPCTISNILYSAKCLKCEEENDKLEEEEKLTKRVIEYKRKESLYIGELRNLYIRDPLGTK